MNLRTVYILSGVLVVLLGLLVWGLLSDSGESSAFVLPGLGGKKADVKQDDIDTVVVESSQPKEGEPAKFVLKRDGSTRRWTITEPITAPASAAAVAQLLSQLFSATRDEKADKPGRLSDWGLEPPRRTVTLKAGEKSFTLHVGDSTADVIYALDPNRRKEPMAVSAAQLDAALRGMGDYRETTLLTSPGDAVTAVKVSSAGDAVALARADDKDQWHYTEPADYGPAEFVGEPAGPGGPAKLGGVSGLLNEIRGLRVEGGAKGFEADNVSDWGKYGLGDADKTLVIEVTKTEQVRSGAASDAKPEKVTSTARLRVALDKKPEKKEGEPAAYYYARLGDGSSVVRVSADRVDAIRKLLENKGQLRDRTLVNTDTPDAVRVENSTGVVELRRTASAEAPPPNPFGGPQMPPPDAWTLWKDEKTSAPADSGSVVGIGSLVGLLRQRNTIEGFYPPGTDEKELELSKPVVSVWAGEKLQSKADKTRPDPTSPEPDVKLTFGKQFKEGDKDLVAVKREVRRKVGGQVKTEVMLLKVNPLVAGKAREGAVSYREKRLEPFTTVFPPDRDVVKVSLTRDGKTTVLSRPKPGELWKIEAPTELAGRDADPGKITTLLMELNELRPEKLVAEKPTPQELTNYGLATPKTKVQITLQDGDKTKTFDYDFGGDASDHAVYGKQSQSDLVFTVEKSNLTRLPTTYVDTTVAKFSPDQVKAAKFTGWIDVNKAIGINAPFVLDLEKKGSDWEVKSPAGFTLSGPKVNQFLRQLSNLRAVEFVTYKTGPKPEQELDPTQGALKIELTIEGEKEPLVLIVGKFDKDKGEFVATSSKLPGDVFTLRGPVATLLEDVKKKPAFFSP